MHPTAHALRDALLACLTRRAVQWVYVPGGAEVEDAAIDLAIAIALKHHPDHIDGLARARGMLQAERAAQLLGGTP